MFWLVGSKALEDYEMSSYCIYISNNVLPFYKAIIHRLTVGSNHVLKTLLNVSNDM